MRIASYNILSGGFNKYYEGIKEPERINLLKQAIQELQAGFVGLIDTYRWDEIYSNDQIAEIFGYKLAYCINLNDDRLRKIGHNNGITVLSNYEVERFETISLKSRDAVKTRLRISGRELDIYTVYLDDLSENARVEQVAELLRQVDANTPSIIMGDLNALKKADLPQFNPLIDKFFRNNPKLLEDYGKVLNEMKSGIALGKIEKHGFKDASRKVEATAPTKLFPAILEEPLLRLDYAFTTGAVEVSSFEVRREELFDLASDHYPIVFDCYLV